MMVQRDPFPQEDKEPVSLALYLKPGLHYRIAEVLYRWIFQPLDSIADRISVYFTRKWCEENTPH